MKSQDIKFKQAAATIVCVQTTAPPVHFSVLFPSISFVVACGFSSCRFVFIGGPLNFEACTRFLCHSFFFLLPCIVLFLSQSFPFFVAEKRGRGHIASTWRCAARGTCKTTNDGKVEQGACGWLPLRHQQAPQSRLQIRRLGGSGRNQNQDEGPVLVPDQYQDHNQNQNQEKSVLAFAVAVALSVM